MKGSRGHARGARGAPGARGRHSAGSPVKPGPNLAPGGGGAAAQHPPAEKSVKRRVADLCSKLACCQHLIGVWAGIVFIGFLLLIVFFVVPPSKQNDQDTPLINPKKSDGMHTTQRPSNVLATPAIVSQANMSANQNPVEPCPEGWMYYVKYCYFFEENETNWSRSNSSCSERKGWLITFKDKGEMGYILKRACRNSHWIGLYKSAEVYMWLNGEPLDESKFTIQGDGECGFIMSDKNRVYISLSTCSLPRSSVCKMTPDKRSDL